MKRARIVARITNCAREPAGTKSPRLAVDRLEDRLVLSDGYSFQPLAFLGDPAPGAGGLTHTFDFEPGAINNRGDAVFGSDLSNDGGTTNIGEGVFLRRRGHTIALARAGDPAPSPDTATLSFAFYGEMGMNNAGDVPFAFQRDPATFVDTDGDGVPDSLVFGQNAGLYLFDHRTEQVSARLLPGTAAPGGGTFDGVGFITHINNAGDIAFSGITTPETLGPGFNLTGLHGETGLGQGVYVMNSRGHISKVVRPGDPAPGGSTFDLAGGPSINERGDVVFHGHIAEEPCTQFSSANIPGVNLFCAQSVYVRDARTGEIRSVAHIGDAAPGGGTYMYAYGGKVNSRGQIAYAGAFAADPAGTGHLPLDANSGVFLNSKGKTIAIARPGDSMPGGGTLLTGPYFTADVWINNAGSVTFSGVISDITGDGREDNGLYRWSHGTISLVAHTGTVIPDVGTIDALKPPALVGVDPRTFSGAAINDRGQVLFTAALTDGRGVVLVATPTSSVTAAIPTAASAALGTESAGLNHALTAGRSAEFVGSGVSPTLDEAPARPSGLSAVPISPGAPPSANPNPGVIPNKGPKYGELGAAWWQWAFSFPAADVPFFNTGGPVDVSAGQSGHVWFLAGANFGLTTPRTGPPCSSRWPT